MVQTKEGAKKARQTMLERFGSEEARKAFYAEIGSKGGKKKRDAPRGFAAMSQEERVEAGRKGGTKSRRTGITKYKK